MTVSDVRVGNRTGLLISVIGSSFACSVWTAAFG